MTISRAFTSLGRMHDGQPAFSKPFYSAVHIRYTDFVCIIYGYSCIAIFISIPSVMKL